MPSILSPASGSVIAPGTPFIYTCQMAPQVTIRVYTPAGVSENAVICTGSPMTFAPPLTDGWTVDVWVFDGTNLDDSVTGITVMAAPPVAITSSSTTGPRTNLTVTVTGLAVLTGNPQQLIVSVSERSQDGSTSRTWQSGRVTATAAWTIPVTGINTTDDKYLTVSVRLTDTMNPPRHTSAFVEGPRTLVPCPAPSPVGTGS